MVNLRTKFDTAQEVGRRVMKYQRTSDRQSVSLTLMTITVKANSDSERGRGKAALPGVATFDF